MTPVIATSFAAPKVAEILNDRFDWRWTFGASAFIVLASCLPITISLFWAGRTFRQAHAADNCATTTANRHRFETLREFFIELDIPGVILAMVGLCLTLLPITIANIVDNGYRNTGIIVMLAAGFVSMVGFVAWEKWLAPVTYMPWALMRDRNLIGGCLVALASVCSVSFWYLYYGSYLQVVHNQSITIAGYITNAYPLVFAISAPLFGM